MSGRKYSDAFKTEALELYARVGLNEAGRQLGIDKKSILRWSNAEGIDTMGVSMQVSERNRVAAASSHAKQAQERAATRERVTLRLLRLSELSLARELEILVAGNFTREDLQAITNARMKAIQQFELLEGRFTERQDFGMEAILVGVAAAIQRAIELLPDALQSMMQEAIALELRHVQEHGAQMLDAGPLDVVEAEDGEFEAVASTP